MKVSATAVSSANYLNLCVRFNPRISTDGRILSVVNESRGSANLHRSGEVTSLIGYDQEDWAIAVRLAVFLNCLAVDVDADRRIADRSEFHSVNFFRASRRGPRTFSTAGVRYGRAGILDVPNSTGAAYSTELPT